MSVRSTERKLPGGIANANAFGFAAINADENVALISYLDKRLVHQHRDDPNQNKPLFNTYVVFADDSFLNAHAGPNETADDVASEIFYVWKFQFLDADNNVLLDENFDHPIEGTYERTSRGILHINSIQMEDDLYYTSDLVPGWEAWFILHSDWARAVSFKMSVEVYKGFGSTIPLTSLNLVHDLRGTAQIIEYLKSTHDGNNQGAYLGREPVTRMVANDYQDYLLSTKLNSHLFNGTRVTMELNTPPNVMAGLMYQNAIQGILEPRFGENDYYEGILNNNDELNPDPFLLDGAPLSALIDYSEDLKMGLVQVKPHLLAMFLPKDENWTTYTPFQRVGENDITEENLFNNFAHLSPEEHIDIYNYLRFPKTNIQSAALILHRLKEEHSEWANLQTEEELGGSPECVRTIATEFWQGPQTDVDDYAPEAKDSFPIGWSPYVQAILLDNSIEYETIHIKVLDIRSGQAIPNARVKKIVVNAMDANEVVRTTAVGEFSPYSQPITNGTLELRAQEALNGMGYHIENPSSTFGPLEKATINAFLSHRVLNDTSILIPVDGEEEPSESHLEYIIGEYHDHRATDENGVLHIRVPVDLMHGNKVHLEVGFWDFPIILEKIISNHDANALLRTSTFENTTNYTIKWIVDYQNLGSPFDEALIPIELRQSTNWEDTILRGGHFGWKVEDESPNQEGMLKVCEKLIIKEDNNDFVIFSRDHFSPFYDEDEYPFHFVFFGMQWCQPVYDERLDGLLGGNPNYNTLSSDPLSSNRNMHLATHHRIDPSPGYLGKEYGKPMMRDFWQATVAQLQTIYEEGRAFSAFEIEYNEWLNNGQIGPEPLVPTETPIDESKQQRLGMRLEAKIGDPVFAMRGGHIKVHSVPHHFAYDSNIGLEVGQPPFHYMGTIYWDEADLKSIHYLHLAIWHHEMVALSKRVMCGQIIGGAGRSTTVRSILSDEPGYLGLSVGDMENGQMVFLRDTVDPANRIVFPTADLPLVFPCRTQVTQGMVINNLPLTEGELEQLINNNGGQILEQANEQTPLYQCQFRNPTYVNHCWAAAELRCPHYAPAMYNQFPPPPPEGYSYEDLIPFRTQIQAQLRFLNERSPDGDSINFAVDNNPQYFHPGAVNGEWSSIGVNMNISLDTNKTLQVLQTAYEGKIIEVRFVDDNGYSHDIWIDADLRGEDGRITVPISQLVSFLEVSENGRIRIAIYFFKKVHGLLDYDHYHLNFSFYADDDISVPIGFDDAAIITLNNVCQALLDATD